MIPQTLQEVKKTWIMGKRREKIVCRAINSDDEMNEPY